MSTCTCKVGPGKFEGEPAMAYLAWESVLNGGGESVGPYEFFKRPYGFDDPEAVQAALDYGYCAACIADYDDDESYGLVVWESDQGFVYLATYATEKRYLKALDCAEAEEEEQGEGE